MGVLFRLIHCKEETSYFQIGFASPAINLQCEERRAELIQRDYSEDGMLKHVVTVGLLAGALALPGKAEAAFITGTLNFTANSFVVNSSGTDVAKNDPTAVGIDFTSDANPSPGTAGAFLVTSASGSFASAGITGTILSPCCTLGTVGAINDFSFAGTGNASFPLPPISGFQVIVSPSFSFDLQSVTVTQQDGSFLSILGFGTLNLAGFQSTPGTFFYSTQGTGVGVFSSSETDQAVPEPGSMVLLGSGLIGLAVLARKRLFSH